MSTSEGNCRPPGPISSAVAEYARIRDHKLEIIRILKEEKGANSLTNQSSWEDIIQTISDLKTLPSEIRFRQDGRGFCGCNLKDYPKIIFEPNVSNISGWFSNSNLEVIGPGGFDLTPENQAQVVYLVDVFTSSRIKRVDISWICPKALYLAATFAQLSAMEGRISLNLPKVISLYSALFNCSKISDVEIITGNQLQTIFSFVRGCFELTDLRKINFNGSRPTEMGYAFYEKGSVEYMPTGFDTSLCVNADYLFMNTDLSRLKNASPLDFRNLVGTGAVCIFNNSRMPDDVFTSFFPGRVVELPKVTSIKSIFKMTLVSSVTLSGALITEISEAFESCIGLTSVTLDIPNVKDLSKAFYADQGLREITFTSPIMPTKLQNAFFDCRSLETINGIIDWTNITDITAVNIPTLVSCRFRNICRRLDLAYLRSLNSESWTYMLENAKTVTRGVELIVPSDITSKVSEDVLTSFRNKGWTLTIR